MKKIIYLNAGHSLTDPGAITLYGKESEFTMAIRDSLIPKLKRNGFLVEKVPDELDLKNSIGWVNLRAKELNDGLALSIQCNCCGEEGAETFYYKYNKASKRIAKILVDEYCRETGIKNRGARSDFMSFRKQLGWIRKTNCWATMIECGFLGNFYDVKILKNSDKVAKAIAKGVCIIYGIEYQEEDSPQSREEIKEQIIELVKRL